MAAEFDRNAFLSALETPKDAADKAAELGATFGNRGAKRIYFVGCGAPNRMMAIVQYWLEHLSGELEIRRYFPAEFISQKPSRIDENTIVILGSKSGTTKETVAAANFLKEAPCKTIGITEMASSPLAKAVDHALLLGETEHANTGIFMALLGFAAGFLKEVQDWNLYDKVMCSLNALPEALAVSIEANEGRSTEEARLYKDDRILYEIAAGPCFATAYIVGVCILMEMQWLHSFPVEAAEFFHGPFEIVDETTPIIALLGEDPSRPQAERAVRFCRRVTERLMIYDSKDFAMPGIDKEVRAFLAPIVLQAVLERFAEHLSVWHNHPLSTRRYMGVLDY